MPIYCVNQTYRQTVEKVLYGVLCDVVGQVSQEGSVRRAAGQPGAVDVWLTGRARSRGQDGPVNGWCPVRILLSVPRCGN